MLRLWLPFPFSLPLGDRLFSIKHIADVNVGSCTSCLANQLNLPRATPAFVKHGSSHRAKTTVEEYGRGPKSKDQVASGFDVISRRVGLSQNVERRKPSIVPLDLGPQHVASKLYEPPHWTEMRAPLLTLF